MGNRNTRLRSKSRFGRSKFSRLIIAFAIPIFCSTSVFAATINVNSTQDNLNAGDGNCTLREALNNSNNDNDTTGGDCNAGNALDTINLPPGTYRISIQGNFENFNATGDFDILDDVNLFGVEGAEATIVGASNDRIVDIFAPNIVHIEDLVFSGGNAVFNANDSGGGIRAFDTVVILDRVMVTGNSANNNGGV